MKRFLILFAIALIGVIGLAPMANATQITFQVNMTVQAALEIFHPGVDQVVVRGDSMPGGWSGYTNPVTDGDGDGIYTGTFEITAGSELDYKYVMVIGGSDTWESVDNRTYTVGADPATLPVVFFNNQSEVPQVTDIEILFRVDMRVQRAAGNFDPDVDYITVRGGTPPLSWGGASVRLLLEPENDGVYSAWVQFDNAQLNANIEYKYVILTGGDPNDPTPGWESTPNRTYMPTGQEPDNLPPPSGNDYGEHMPPLVFWSDINFDAIISHDLQVIFQIEDTPLLGRIAHYGYVTDVQTHTDTIRQINTIEAAGFFNAWPWGGFDPAHVLNDNGQDGDLTAGDHVWSKRILFPMGSPRELIYKYGVNGYDAEAGFAMNHSRILDDSGDEFRMDVDCWGSPDTLYSAWACVISAADDYTTPAPAVFALEQNFPNPFNPTTAISFTLNLREFVKLSVFDITGRTVQTMNLGRLEPGKHTVGFDGANLATGVYFYRLESPSFAQTKKMLLLK